MGTTGSHEASSTAGAAAAATAADPALQQQHQERVRAHALAATHTHPGVDAGAGHRAGVERRRVTVVGAGAVGVSCAYYLQKRGHSVTLVERIPSDGEEDSRRAASWGNAGVLAAYERLTQNKPALLFNLPSMLWGDGFASVLPTWHFLTHSVPWGARLIFNCSPAQHAASSRGLAALNAHAHAAWTEMVDDFTDPAHRALVRDAGVWHAVDDAAWDAYAGHETEARRAGGVGVSLLSSREEAAAHEPALARRGSEEGGAVAFPRLRGGGAYAGALAFANPPRLLALVRDELFVKRYGGTVVRGEAVDVRQGGREVVVALDGGNDGGGGGGQEEAVLHGDTTVIAVGADALSLLPRLGESRCGWLDIERGYSIGFTGAEVEEGGSCALTHPVGWSPLKFFFSPMEHGLRVAGLTELGGAAAPPDPTRWEWLERNARALLPELPARDVGYDWIGFRPTTTDLLPVISWSETRPDVLHCFGHGHYGVTQGAVSGRLVEQMVSGVETDVDMAPYSISRFWTF